MIINFKLKNYNSYKNEQTLDFTKKSKEKSGNKFINTINNLDILNVTGLVGVNGSGKTSLIESLDFMKKMVLNSQNHNVNTTIRHNPFLTEIGKPTEFEITFISENKKYIYGFSYTNEKIIKEYLKAYDTQKPTEVFAREKQEFKFNEKYEKELKLISTSVIPQTLMLSRAVQMNSKALKPVFDFFTKIFTINNLFRNPIDFSLLNDNKLKENLLDKLSFADFSIHDLELVKGKMKNITSITIKEDSITRENIEEEDVMNLLLIHKHKNKDLKINFIAESSGTQKFILIFYNLLKLSKDSIILYDEIENSFNIEIVEFIINYFANNKTNSQLIFTTHQPEILNYLRSDQINIIDKKDSTSEIVILHSIVRDNTKINKNYGDYYKEGVLGGVPSVYKED
ncbi:MAG: AAA family ATPase [Candidatus Aenigmarchaeota archaeon]|nr:AAA family ATPase [Candidatus Aenigmarchaeota archaeon]